MGCIKAYRLNPVDLLHYPFFPNPIRVSKKGKPSSSRLRKIGQLSLFIKPAYIV
jgi:hypothetical protein